MWIMAADALQFVAAQQLVRNVCDFGVRKNVHRVRHVKVNGSNTRSTELRNIVTTKTQCGNVIDPITGSGVHNDLVLDLKDLLGLRVVRVMTSQTIESRVRAISEY
jgi:hypothetical protein